MPHNPELAKWGLEYVKKGADMHIEGIPHKMQNPYPIKKKVDLEL